MPLRPLLLLVAAVLATHWWVLGAAPVSVRVREPLAVTTFITRSVAASVRPDAAPAAESTAKPEPVRAKAVVVPPKRARQAEPAAIAIAIASETPEPSPSAQSPVVRAVATVAREPAASAAGSAQPTPRLSIPAAARLHYQVTAAVRQIRLQGEGELLWRHDGTSYDAQLVISSPLLPSRIQHSTGLITAEGLEPLRFSDKARSEEAAHFLRDQGKVTFSNNRPDAPLVAGTQDRLSVMLQLGAMVGGAPAKFPAGTVISVPTASTREAEPWLFTVEGEETLELPGGKVAALKLIRNPRREFDQTVELWLASAMDYVPVRLRLTQANGDWVDQQWSSTDRR